MISPDDINSIAVYPPIGIARVGNADGDDGFYLASEIIGKPSEDLDRYRNTEKQLKRQAVRFRIYVTLKNGDVRELTASDSIEIQWRVQVANLKAGWYEFNQAMDLPNGFSKPASKRNAGLVQPSDRRPLDIIPKSRTITGINQRDPDDHFDEGQFFDRPVSLGEIRTDEFGRLIFIGAKGVSAPRHPGSRATTFANNDLWHDDVCDGTVRATVTIKGESLEAKPGYVVVAPPNYGQGLYAVVTMGDVVRDLFLSESMIQPEQISFTRDIWPIFSRMSDMSWTNHGIYMLNGTGSPLDAANPEVVTKLGDKSVENAPWRTRVFKIFRPAKREGPAKPATLPPFYGDAYGERVSSVLEGLEVTRTMYAHLQLWAEGNFDADWPGSPPELPVFEELDAKQQIEHLDRAGLHECIGGPFHPGIELTWIMRSPRLWESAYRLKVLPEDGATAKQDFGPELTPEACLGKDGPLDGVAPGSLTRWLGVPWQTDEASCNSDADYAPSLYLSFPSFWGARVPNQVLSDEAWNRVRDTASPTLQRIKHYSNREAWMRDIRGLDYSDRINNMVAEWGQLGMLLPNATSEEEQSLGLPKTVYIESGRDDKYAGSNEKLKLIAAVENIDQPTELESGLALEVEQEFIPPLRTYKRGEV